MNDNQPVGGSLSRALGSVVFGLLLAIGLVPAALGQDQDDDGCATTNEINPTLSCADELWGPRNVTHPYYSRSPIVQRSLQFTNATAGVSMPALGSLGAQWTLECWVKPATAGQNADLIVRTDGTNFAYRLYLTNGIPAVEFDGDTVFTPEVYMRYRAGGNTNLPAGVWSHIAGVWNQEAQSLALFVDGQQIQGRFAPAARPFVGGSTVLGSGYQGHMDDVALWTLPRTSAEFAGSRSVFGFWQDNQVRFPGASVVTDFDSLMGLAAWYPFDDGGITAEDYTEDGGIDVTVPPAFTRALVLSGSGAVMVADDYVDLSGCWDVDRDGMPDWWELLSFNGAVLSEIGTEILPGDDSDGDGLSNLYEYYVDTNPMAPDSDNDGILDGEEDFDRDGLSNADESILGTDPRLPDTDDDGLGDLDEILNGSDPADALNPLEQRALVFDGAATSVLRYPLDPRFALRTWTLEAWVRPDAGWTNGGVVIVREIEAGVANYFLRLENGMRPAVGFGTNLLTAVNAIPADGSTWTHLAASYDAGTRELRLHVNGVERGRKLTGSTIRETGVGPIVQEIGRGFAGLIDEVRIWSSALAAATIDVNREFLLRGNEPGLVAYYRMDDGSHGLGTSGVAGWTRGQVQEFAAGYANDWIQHWAHGATLSGSVVFEVVADGTGPINPDSDGDGMTDAWEIRYGLDPYDPSDAEIDADGDGLTSYWEYRVDGDPYDPFSLDPDGVLDDAQWDSDGDGLSNEDEIVAYGTDPANPDTDDDGLADGNEVHRLTSPVSGLSPHVLRSLKLQGQCFDIPEGPNPALQRFDIDAWSLEFWVQPISNAMTTKLMSRSALNPTLLRSQFEVGLTNGRPYVAFDTATGQRYIAGALADIPVHEWSYLAAVWDPEKSSLQMYVDGISYSAQGVVEIPVSGPGRTRLGAADGSTYAYIDQLRVWGLSLTEAEVHYLSDRFMPTLPVLEDETVAVFAGGLTFHRGINAFAQSVFQYTPGIAPDGILFAADPGILGPPDYEPYGTNETGLISLGIGDLLRGAPPMLDPIQIASFNVGSVVVDMGDQILRGSGDSRPDLVVFEGASHLDPFYTFVSVDGDAWHYVGYSSGGQTEFDLDSAPLNPLHRYPEGLTHFDYWGVYPLDPSDVPQDDLDGVFAFWFELLPRGDGQAVVSNEYRYVMIVDSGVDNGLATLGLPGADIDAVGVLEYGRGDEIIAWYPFDDSQNESVTNAMTGGVAGFGAQDFVHQRDWEDGWRYAIRGAELRFDEAVAAPVVGILDSDGDGLPDWWERFWFGDESVADMHGDPDGDGLSNLYEYWLDTNPLASDTDNDGILDGDEDFDGDGLSNREEQRYGSHPRLPDTDDDGIIDGLERRPASALAPMLDRVLAFNGAATAYVEMPRQARFALPSFTLQAWVQPEALGGTLVAREVQAGVRNYALNLTGTGQVELRFTPGDLTAEVVLASPLLKALVVGEWTHVAGTFNALTGRLSIHLDGVEVATTTTTKRPATNGVGPIWTRAGAGFAGRLDEVAIFDRALSAAVIGGAAEGIAPNPPDGLVSYYRFDDGTSATGPDTNGYWYGTSLQASWSQGQVEDFASRVEITLVVTNVLTNIVNDAGETVEDLVTITNSVRTLVYAYARDWRSNWRNAGTLRGQVGLVEVDAGDEAPVLLSLRDSNGDGIPDWWYVAYDLDPTGPSVADEDWDGDGLNSYWEFRVGGDPNGAFSLDPGGVLSDADWDVDGDGLSNRDEIMVFHTDPLLPDTDDDGYADGTEVFFDQPNPADAYGIRNQVSDPLGARSPLIQRSYVASGSVENRSLEAPFSDRFAFMTEVAGELGVTITAPTDGAQVDVRYVEISADITSEDPIETVRIVVNGQIMAVLGAVESVTETIIIFAGENEIRVEAASVSGATGSDTVTVTGTFAPADIRVTQTWSVEGDLDTWLVDPQGRHMGWTGGGPGYPQNVAERMPGAFLDIDDIPGTGPENITLEQDQAVEGNYQVWMNNFSNGGNPESTVMVLVNEGRPGQQFRRFGPQAMPVSDGNGNNPEAWWNTTTVSWPSGTMNPPGEPVSLGLDDGENVEGGFGATRGWTLEAWIRPETAEQTGAIMVYRAHTGETLFALGLEANAPYVRIRVSGGVEHTMQGGAIPAGEWTHLAGVYSEDQQSLRLFVNGFFVGSRQVLQTRDTRFGELYIDTHAGSNDGALFDNAYLDEIRVWSRARNGGLLQSHMHRHVPRTATLVAYYAFDDGGLGIQDFAYPLDRDYDLAGYPLPDLLTDPKPGADGVWGTVDDIAAGPGADGHNDLVTHRQYAWVFGELDSDRDGLPDWWETLFAGNATDADAMDDTDEDGLTSLTEYQVGTHPLDWDTDANGILDPHEDYDRDGLVNLLEQAYGTDPRLWDTDNNGMSDFESVAAGMDPLDSLVPLTNRVLRLDGDPESYVRLAHAERFALLSWVVEAWVHPEARGDAEIVARQTQAGRYNYILRLRADGRPEVGFHSLHDGGYVAHTPTPTNLVPLGVWTHLRGGFDAASRMLYIEVNGNRYEQALVSSQLPDRSGNGPHQTLVGRGFTGMLDEVRIWSAEPNAYEPPVLAYPTRGSSDILRYFYTAAAYPLRGDEAGLVAYLRFDDGVVAPHTPHYEPWAWNVVRDYAHVAGDQPWTEHWLTAARVIGAAVVMGAPTGAPADVMYLVDHNGDGIPDWWQRRYWPAFNPQSMESGAWSPYADPDGDGLWNLTEYLAGLDPRRAVTGEVGLPDGQRDADGDGLNNLYEQDISGSRVDLVDTDDDGVSDWEEAMGRRLPGGWQPFDPVPGDADLALLSMPLNSLSPAVPRSALFAGDGRIVVNHQERHALSSWTVQAWVRPVPGADGIILRRAVHNREFDASAVNYELGVMTDTEGYLAVYAQFQGFTGLGAPVTYRVDGTQAGEVTGGQQVANRLRLEDWSHVAATYDEKTRRLSLYIDGELVTYRDEIPLPYGLGFLEGRLYIGDVTIGGGALAGSTVEGGFTGHIDDVMIMGGAADLHSMRDSASRANRLAAALRAVPDARVLAAVPQTLDEALEQPHAAGQILVRFRGEITPQQVKTTVAPALGLQVIERFTIVPVHVMRVTDGLSLKDKLMQVRAQPSVLYAEPNFQVRASAPPNDPLYPNQYALNNNGQTGGALGADIDAEGAWVRTTGSRSVRVAVIDSGVDYTHPDLAANMRADLGRDFYDNDEDPMDEEGHGTHVAGVIGAVGGNALGIAGLNWNAEMVALRFLGPFGGTTADGIRAIEYSWSIGARVSNNSWGGGGYSQALYDAIQAAGNAGQLFVAAAGNDGSNNDATPAYPASFDLPNILAVAASDHNDSRPGFSNYGLTSVDLAAPGDSILSTLPGGSYGVLSGTSMAAPQVAGVAALIFAKNPGMGHAQVKQAILNNVDKLEAWEGVVLSGGRLNAASAVGGGGAPVLYLTFNDGGVTVEDMTMGSDWNYDWFHAGEPLNMALDAVEYYDRGIDSNQDGIPDWWYEAYGFDPFGASVADDDPDGDGLSNRYEHLAGTHPLTADSNRDGTLDANEDPDGDGLTNVQEQELGTNPLLWDTDDDGRGDRTEVTEGTNPLNAYDPFNPHAMRFQGNGRLLIQSETDVAPAANWTVEAWVRPMGPAVDGLVVRRAEKFAFEGQRWVDYELGVEGNVPYIAFAYRQGGVLVQQRTEADRPIAEGRWTHLAGVMDHADNQLRLYVDGMRLGLVRPVVRPPLAVHGAFETTIGGGDLDPQGRVQDGFVGELDAVRIWGYARSGLEIQVNRDVLLPEFSDYTPDRNRAPLRLFNFDSGATLSSYAHNSRYVADWLNGRPGTAVLEGDDPANSQTAGWRHAALRQGDAAVVAAVWPPLSLNSDDDGTTDDEERKVDWGVHRSEIPFRYNALSFDGTAGTEVFVDELEGNNHTMRYALTNWTVEAWVRPTALPVADGLTPLVRRETRPEDPEKRITFELGIERRDGAIYPYARLQRDDAGNAFIMVSGALALPYGTTPDDWSHLAATFDNGELTLYLDGSLHRSRTFTGAWPAIGGLGGLYFGSEGYIGELQEIRIWERPRSEAEIRADFRKLLLFSTAEIEGSYVSGGPFLGRVTETEEDGLVYDYTQTCYYEGVPYICGRTTHKFSVEAWVRMEPGAAGGIVAERKVNLQINDDDLAWLINHSLRITENGAPQGMWQGAVRILTPIRVDINDVETVVGFEYVDEFVERNVTSEIDIRDGKWHHLALVGDSLQVKLYVDGKLDRQNPTYYEFRTRPGEAFESWYWTYDPIGSELRIADGGLAAVVDEVSFWNEDLTPEEISRHRAYGLDRLTIQLGLQPISPLPDYAVDPGGPRHRLVSYATFDGEIDMPFVPDRVNERIDYRIYPQPTGNEIVSPSAPPIEVDRVRNFDRRLQGYFAAVDGGAHVENFMERNSFASAGQMLGAARFTTLDTETIEHLVMDSDGDGIEEWWYWEHGFDPGEPPAATSDLTGDGLNLYWNFKLGSDPHNAYSLDPERRISDADWDSDGDGLSNRDEIHVIGSDPTNPDTDDDGVFDGVEVDALTVKADGRTLTSPLYSRSPLVNRSLALTGTAIPVPAGTNRWDLDRFDVPAWTIELWVRPATAGQTGSLVRRVGDFNGRTSFDLRLDANVPSIRFETQGGNAVVAGGSVAIPTGVWTHLAGVFDLERDSLELYINGVSYRAQVVMEPSPRGRGTTTIGDGLFGNIDELRIWDRARSADQIRENMQRFALLPTGEPSTPWEPSFALWTNWLGTVTNGLGTVTNGLGTVMNALPDWERMYDGTLFALGDRAFADEVMASSIVEDGTITTRLESALGAPDRLSTNLPAGGRTVTFGRGDWLALRFSDNALAPGGDAEPDLRIYEMGMVEGGMAAGLHVAISSNAIDWIDVGTVGGAVSALDIDPFVDADALFYYVMLIDDGISTNGTGLPGAVLDAVGAITAIPADIPRAPLPAAWYPFDDKGAHAEDYIHRLDWNFALPGVTWSADGDGVTLMGELDADNDGLPDWWEAFFYGDDGDALPLSDDDGDGLNNLYEYYSDTNPWAADTDNNGILDIHEDRDGDGLENLMEQRYGSHPGLPDTDDDGVLDGEEVTRSWFPANSMSQRKIMALALNGSTNTYVAFPRQHRFMLPEWTVEAWVKLDALGTNGILIAREVEQGVFNYHLSINAAGQPEALFTAGDRTTNIVLTHPGVLTTGVWHHVMAAFDGSLQSLLLTVNAESPVSLVTAHRPAFSGIGMEGAVVGRGLRGSIDEVRLWNRMLATRSLVDLQRSLRGSEPGLVAYLRFDDGSHPLAGGTSGVDAWTWGQVEDFVHPDDWPNFWLHAATLVGDARLVPGGVLPPPDDRDCNNNGLPDWWEALWGWDPCDGENPDSHPCADPDRDGLINLYEYLASVRYDPIGANVLSPLRFDSDGDGVPDYYDRYAPCEPMFGELFDDGDGLPDCWELEFPLHLSPFAFDPHEDSDGDGFSNLSEWFAGTDPSVTTNRPNPVISGRILYRGAAGGDYHVIAYQTVRMDGLPAAVGTVTLENGLPVFAVQDLAADKPVYLLAWKGASDTWQAGDPYGIAEVNRARAPGASLNGLDFTWSGVAEVRIGLNDGVHRPWYPDRLWWNDAGNGAAQYLVHIHSQTEKVAEMLIRAPRTVVVEADYRNATFTDEAYRYGLPAGQYSVRVYENGFGDGNSPIYRIDSFNIEPYLYLTMPPPALIYPNGAVDVPYGRPVFQWNMTAEAQAFQVEFTLPSRKTETRTIAAPWRDANTGYFAWDSPVLFGDGIYTNGAYGWRVRYGDGNVWGDWTSKAEFNIKIERASFGPASIAGKVFYYGQIATNLVVEAFSTAGFSGEPEARQRIRTPQFNADRSLDFELLGLRRRTYYLRAFMDLNNDLEPQRWEAHGFARDRAYGLHYPYWTEYALGTFNMLARDRVSDAIIVVTSKDTDTDDMADDWEQFYLGTLNRVPTQDVDGDGYTLQQEYACGVSPWLAGLGDPTDADVTIVMLGMNLQVQGGMAVRWHQELASDVTYVYTLEYRDSMVTTGAWQQVDFITGSGTNTLELIDLVNTNACGFYRIRATPMD